MNKTKRQKLTASVLTFVIIFQTIAGVFIPNDVFKAQEAHAGWYDAGYGYKKEIKVDHAKVSPTDHIDQTNFPMLVSFTDPLLKTVANGGRVTDANGYDIIFTNAAGSTKLDHEIEKYVPTTGELVMWVKIPVLSASIDTSIYIYYGNAAITTTQENKTGVWDDGGGNNFKMVQHMNQNPGGVAPQMLDSTQYANNGTSGGTMTSGNSVTGRVDGATSFDGTDDYIDAGSGNGSLNFGTGTYSVSWWAKYPQTQSGTYASVFSKGFHTNAQNANTFGMAHNNNATNGLRYYEIGDNIGSFATAVTLESNITDGWHYFSFARDIGSSKLKLYDNGSLVANVDYTANVNINNASNLYLMKTHDNYAVGAQLDEVRISNTARSAGWIATEYNNQSQPTEFSSLGIEEVSSPSALSSFAYRKAITIDHTKVSGTTNLTNFPVLINLPTDTSLAAHAQNPSGNDILFTSSTTAWNTGTTNDKLAHEIETYTASNGSLQAWVKIPSLNSASASQDTVIYMYYGNATATSQQNKTAVWDTNTKMVQHMNGSATPAVGDFKDSTQYANNSTNNTNEPTATTGQIDGAQSFNGTSQYIDAANGSSLNLTDNFTISSWVYPTLSLPGGARNQIVGKYYKNYEFFVSPWNTSANQDSIAIFKYKPGGYEVIGASLPMSINRWHFVSATLSGSSVIFNVDGVFQTVSCTAGGIVNNSYPLNIGRRVQDNSDYFNGTIDEVRISNTARSADWISTEYNNQSQPTEFSSLGIEEVSSPSALSSFAYRKAITIDHTKVSGTTNLTNFPVLINLPTDASLAAHAQNPSGNDILFTLSSTAWNTGTTNDKLAHEIETYTASNGSLQAWVKIPSLNASNASQDTVIYMYYGNATATSQQNKTAVWDTNTKMVQHLKETGTNPTVYDSTQYANNSTSQTWTPTTAGQIGGSGSFNGVSSVINVGSGASLRPDIFTYETWVKHSGPSGSEVYQTLAGWSNSLPKMAIEYTTTHLPLIYMGGSNYRYFSATNPVNIYDNNWHHLVFVVPGIGQNDILNSQLYVDGRSQSTQSTTMNSGAQSAKSGDFKIGETALQYLIGSLDEVRISNTARSASWIATEYNNQSQPTEFSTLGIEEVSAPAALSSFAYRKAITIDHTKVSGTTNLTNFPVLINLPTDASLAAHAQADGDDILFTSSSIAWNTGTTNDKLSHEIETYTAANGSLQAWVKIPTLNASSASQDTVIYMYYGNATATSQQNKTAVWDTNTKMVQHMNQTGTGAVGDYKDSTQYGNNSTNTVNQPTAIVGQVDGAESFDGTTNYIDAGNSNSLNFGTGAMSFDVWVNATAQTEDFPAILDKSTGADWTGVSAKLGFWLGNRNMSLGNNYLLQLGDGTTTNPTSPDNVTFGALNGSGWNHLVGTVDSVGGTPLIKAYKNGVLVDSKSRTLTGSIDSTFNLNIGQWRGYSRNLAGSIDEVRISNTARSAGWIATEYNNQSQPTEFSSLGIEEVSSPSALSSFAYRKAITIDHTKVSGTTNLTNFPVLINLPTDASLAAHAQNPSGNDILFTSSSINWNTGTTNDKLAHEIETYTASNGSLQAWVKIPSLNSASASQDTVIYMYYGNATATNQQNKTAVWDTNTKMVQHMNQTGTGAVGDYKDSTQYGNNSTNTANQPTVTTGQVDGAESFNGTSGYVGVGNNNNLNAPTEVTIAAWVKFNTVSSPGSIMSKRAAWNTPSGYALVFDSATVNGIEVRGRQSNLARAFNAGLVVGNWYYIVGTLSDNGLKNKVYINGVGRETSVVSTETLEDNTSNVNIGSTPAPDNYFNGSIDEVRISNTARSAGWIATEYNNQSIPLKSESTPAGFLALGAENIYRLEITGSATQTAGVSQPVTLYAKDAAGNTMTNFTGDKTLTLGGASASPNNTNPTCSDKNATDISFGAPTTLNFVSGVATCNLKLFKAESASVTSTGISTITSNLSVTVSPNALSNFLVDAPASGNSGTAFATTITSRDAYNNTTRTVSGATALSVNSGSISPNSISVGNFTDDGVWTGNLTISNITEQPSVAITATNATNTGTDSIAILGIPANPQNASASRNTDYSITTTWQDSSTVESGFRIERKVNDGSWSAYAEIGTVGAGITTFTDNSVSNPANAPVPDRAYQYRVRAYNTIGNSAGYSEDSTIHYTTPNVPSNVFSSYLTDNSFRVNYTDNAAVTNTHRIQRCSNANCGISYETDLSTFTSSPQTDSTSINPNSRYRWQARSETPGGVNSNFASSNFEYTTPNSPTIQSTTYVSGSQLTVNWIDTSNYEDGFRIEVSTDNGAYTEVTPGTNTVGANINVYAFTSLPDHNYKFKVRAHIGSTAHNSEIFSSYSGESVAVYTTSSAPTISAPTVNSSTSINWHWTDNSAFEENFRLHFVSGSGTDVNNLPANSTGYETNGLTPNTKYAVHIHSYRADTGESDPSNPSDEVYTFANIPIMSLTADSERKITAHWNANQNPLGTKYFIENMSSGADSDWIENTSWSSDELFCGEEYSFRIKARNESNIETAFSDAVSVKTANCPPGIPVSAGNPPQAPAKTEDNPQGVFKVSINSGEKYTNNSIVHLNLLAGSDTNRLAISNTADFKNASIVPYTQEMDWDMNTPPLQEGNQSNTQTQGCENPLLRGELKGCVGFEDGLHTVYVKFYTRYGAASSAVSDSIMLDTTAPNFTLSNLKANYTINDAISLQGVTEPNTKLVYNLDSQRVGVLNTTNTKFTIDLGKLTEGSHSLKIFAQDTLGNSSDTMSYFINIVKPITLPVPVPEVPGTGVKPKPPTTTPTPTGIPTVTKPSPSIPAPSLDNPTIPQPGINVPSLNTPTNNNTNPDNPDIDTGNISPQTPASMQGEWNLLTLKPLPQRFTQEDIQMIIQKFPEFKKTFQDLGITDFQNADKLKNVSLNLPSLSDILGLNPTNLTANLPNTNTPIASLNPTFKKGIPENIVFIKTQGDNIDINSALNFENGTANQKVSLLSGKTFQLLIRPDQEVKAIQGYITFKESKVSRADTPKNLISKISSLIHHTNSVYAADNIEEKLVLSEFSYQDEDKDGIWSAEIQTPQVSGEYELINVLQYKDIKLGSKAIRLITVVDPEGYVYRTEADGEKTRITNAVVSIYWFNSETKTYELWDAAKYQQQNPQTTDDRGTYSFLVPPGSYYLKVETKGYANYESKPFDVTAGSGVHMNLEVKRQPDWKDRFNWQNLVVVVFGIGLFYNFYEDRKRKKKRQDIAM